MRAPATCQILESLGDCLCSESCDVRKDMLPTALSPITPVIVRCVRATFIRDERGDIHAKLDFRSRDHVAFQLIQITTDFYIAAIRIGALKWSGGYSGGLTESDLILLLRNHVLLPIYVRNSLLIATSTYLFAILSVTA